MPNETRNWIDIVGEGSQTFINKHIVNHDETLWWNLTESMESYKGRGGLLEYNKDNTIMFTTPWEPLLEWMRHVIKTNPHLDFYYVYYDEYTEEFYGYMVGIGGKVIIDNTILLGELNYEDNIINKLELDGDEDLIDEFFEDNKYPNSDCFNEIKHNGNSIEYHTTEKPCIEWILNLIKKYPSITFKYQYMSNGFYGWIVGSNGKLITSDFICFDRCQRTGVLELYKYKNYENFIKKIEN